ncbi:MAG: hypothetical protein J0H52_06640, partial [Comamonadaceae bacterium]|nr:hypothetical protein [Comamonadaceae bacterium]
CPRVVYVQTACQEVSIHAHQYWRAMPFASNTLLAHIFFPHPREPFFFGSCLDMKIAWKIKKIKERQYVTKRANLLAK